jgi:hypothetical protein
MPLALIMLPAVARVSRDPQTHSTQSTNAFHAVTFSLARLSCGLDVFPVLAIVLGRLVQASPALPADATYNTSEPACTGMTRTVEWSGSTCTKSESVYGD